MNKKGDTKLAIILISLLLVIMAVPIFLTPSLTGFSYFSLDPHKMQLSEPQDGTGLAKITAYAVRVIPNGNESIIIGAVIFVAAITGTLTYLARRRSKTLEKPASDKLEVPTEPLMPDQKASHVGMSKAMLDSFIKRAALHGQSREDVLEILSAEGWPREEVKFKIDEIFKQNSVEIKRMKESNTQTAASIYDKELDKIQEELNKLGVKEKII